jgi:7-keto-8-aminopelargonate synthetase-like enzyme
MDIFDKCHKFTIAREAIASGYYPFFLPMTNNEGTEAVYHGKRLIMCGSNNYLGLTTHPRVRQAAIDAIQRYGDGCTGSRFANGTWSCTSSLSVSWLSLLGSKLPDLHHRNAG